MPMGTKLNCRHFLLGGGGEVRKIFAFTKQKCIQKCVQNVRTKMCVHGACKRSSEAAWHISI